MSKKSDTESEMKLAIDRLREKIKPGDTVYTVVKSVARTGMSRRIDIYILNDDRDIVRITREVAVACGYSLKNGTEGMLVPGGGMDMCLDVVCQLGRTLFPDGGPLDKSNWTRQHQEKGSGKDIETDGGYLLRKVDL